MEPVLEQQIRQRAYDIWETLGRPEGASDQHWLTAERELLAAFMAPAVRPARGLAGRGSLLGDRNSPTLGPERWVSAETTSLRRQHQHLQLPAARCGLVQLIVSGQYVRRSA